MKQRVVSLHAALILCIICFCINCFSVFGQTPTGTIQGTITDPSGGAVANAAVTITNAATNESRKLTADSGGHYVLPFLTPGTYSVTVTAPGFRSAKEDNITIEVAQNRSVNIALTVGAVNEEVDVTASTAPIDTNTSTMGTVVDTKKVIDLPLNGRNPFSLAGLVPTVSNVGNASTPHIGGSRNAINEEQLDGVSNILPENNVGNTTAAYTPIVDSVQEFSVQTNALAAEYGRFGGGVINLVTKSGTNTFHGDLFEFQRDAVLNANDYFSNRAGQSRPGSSIQQYGGTIGGPVIVPKYNGKDRTFFFFGFQGTNSTVAGTITDTVPTAAVRTGDFTGIGSTIYDPLTVTAGPNGSFVRQPFAGNLIPASRFDPVAVKAMSYFPLPNTGVANAQTNNYVDTGNSLSNDYRYDSRVDHDFTDKWHMFLRFSHDWNNSTQIEDYGNVASQGGGGPTSGGAWSASMDHVITISPTLILDLRYGLSRSYVTRTPFSDGFNPASLGFPESLTAVAAQRVLEFPRFSFSNGAGLGDTGYVDLIENPMAHSVTGSLTKINGAHTIKFGGEFRKLFINFKQYGFPDGQFNFDQTWTQQVLSNANGTGSSYASFLLGLPTSGMVTHEPTAADASVYIASYIQDDWKVSSKFTINMGLRWDIETPRTERYNQLSYWNNSLQSPLQGLVPASACPACGDLLGQMLFVGDTGKWGRHQGPINWTDLGPRFGFAWNPFSKTVIRSGFGLFYAPSALQAAGTSGAPGIEGFNTTTQFLGTTNNQQTILATLSNPFPTGYYLPKGAAGGPLTDVGLAIGDSFFDSYRNPYSEEWNFNIQQELPGQMTVEVGYLANHGLFLVDGDPGQNYDQLLTSNLALGNTLYNQVPNPFYGLINTPGSPLAQPTVLYSQLLRPYPQYNGVMSFRKPRATSMYQGMTVRIDKRLSKGLTFLVSFTGSKTMDNSAAAVNYLGPTSGTRADQYNDRLEWAVSPQDVSRSVVTSFVYELPVGRGQHFANHTPRYVNAIIGGWQVNGILTFATGTPVVLGAAINQTGIYTLNQRPDNTGQSAMLSHQTINEWFNTSVFYQPPPFTIGNGGRTLPGVRNPSETNADLSLFKNNYFGAKERYNLQFRLEAFNALNHTQFGTVNSSIQNLSAFGTITSTGVSARQVQLAAKFVF